MTKHFKGSKNKGSKNSEQKEYGRPYSHFSSFYYPYAEKTGFAEKLVDKTPLSGKRPHWRKPTDHNDGHNRTRHNAHAPHTPFPFHNWLGQVN